MMGQHDRSESFFYYFRIENQVPENHLLRFIDRYISFDFVREKLRASYSETGRPSIDLEVLLRILLLGYLYGITSERKLLEELRTHLAWRWFTELGFEQEIPHHSTFSKNRHGRFEESNLFQELFERTVEQCMAAGLVEGEQHGEREPPQSYPPPTVDGGSASELWGAEWQRLTPHWHLSNAFIPIGKCSARSGSLVADLAEKDIPTQGSRFEEVSIGGLVGKSIVDAFAWGTLSSGTRLVLSIFRDAM